MAYDDPYLTEARSITATGATAVRYWKSPKKYECSLKDIHADVTTAFVGTATPAKIEVGTAADPDAYGTLFFGSAATPSPVSVALRASDKANTSGMVAEHTIPANSQVKITYTQGTGGAPAGVADVTVIFGVMG